MKLTASQLKKIKNLGLSVVYLFGSYAEGKSLPFSDVDIAVLFKEASRLDDDIGGIYNELYDVFTGLFPSKNMDIVFLQKANLELCFDVVSHGKVIYEDSRDARLNFEERINYLYADFKPLLKEINQAILNRS